MIDIGANLGVYSLPIARLVGPQGKVFAYEPASETRRLLAISKTKNGVDHLHIVAAALSDSPREGHLVLGASSELNTLDGTGPGERVQITSLDAEDQTRNWGEIDFIKIDAEGEEERILAGAEAFFAKRSPLVMFEVRAGEKTNENLRSAFLARGFELYRVLGAAPVLVPVGADEMLDAYELNLFAVKPDRAAALAADGFLIRTIPTWTPDDGTRARALESFRAQPFTPIFAQLPDGDSAREPVYRDALTGYAVWRSSNLPLPERYAALRFACDTLTALCENQGSLSRLSTLARITWEMGRRNISVHTLKVMADVLKQGNGRIMEPFRAANPRFDQVAPGAKIIEWFVMAALEQFEQTAFYSSYFETPGVDLDWLNRQPFASVELEHRRVLQRARAGQTIEVPLRLMAPAKDHLNTEAWSSGKVPNTVVRRG